jgi:hypothetical protein
VVESLEFRPSSQCIFVRVRRSCFFLVKMCLCQASRGYFFSLQKYCFEPSRDNAIRREICSYIFVVYLCDSALTMCDLNEKNGNNAGE